MLWVSCKIKDTDLLLLFCCVRRDPFTGVSLPSLHLATHQEHHFSHFSYLQTHKHTSLPLQATHTHLFKNQHKMNSVTFGHSL